MPQASCMVGLVKLIIAMAASQKKQPSAKQTPPSAISVSRVALAHRDRMELRNFARGVDDLVHLASRNSEFVASSN